MQHFGKAVQAMKVNYYNGPRQNDDDCIFGNFLHCAGFHSLALHRIYFRHYLILLSCFSYLLKRAEGMAGRYGRKLARAFRSTSYVMQLRMLA